MIVSITYPDGHVVTETDVDDVQFFPNFIVLTFKGLDIPDTVLSRDDITKIVVVLR